MVDRIKSLSPEMKSRANDFIREEAEEIAQAARDMVPVDSGKLRDSIRVEQAGLSQGRESSSGRFTSSGDISISVVAGGSDIPYALAVHEYPSQHNPPTWNGKPVTFSPSGSGAKFIEHPLAQASRGMAKRIREKVFAGVMIAGVLVSYSLSASPLTDDYFQISGISPLAFGAKAWREPVASVILLPASGNLTGDTRLVLDSLTLYVWSGSAWVQGAAGPQGATGAQGPQGPAGEDGQDGAPGANGADGQPRQLQDEGVDLTIRPKVNMIGSSITCVDNSGQSRTDCTVTGGGSLSVPGVGSELLYRLDSDELAALTNSSVSGSDITIPGQLIFLSGLRLKNSSGELDARNADDTEFVPFRTYAIAIRVGNANSAILHSDKSLGFMFASDYPIVWWTGSTAGSGSVSVRLDRDADGVLKLSDALKLNPRSSPPVTCGSAGSESVIYYDTSHALCVCGTSTWHNLTPSDGGSCS